MATADSGFVQELNRDLSFLRKVGVLSEAAASELDPAVERLAPEAVWVGFDYVDPVLKNFVMAADDGRICAIDIESLVDGQLLGTGVAKALLRWMEPHRAVFLDALDGLGAPDFRSYLPFVELSFLASYTKFMFLEKKWRKIDPKRFERFRKP